MVRPTGRLRAVIGLAAIAALLCTAHAAAATPSFDRQFRGADRSAGAMYRWWWPGAQVSDEELTRELTAIAGAGYKGVEIADVMDSLDYPVDPDKYGYGTARWNSAVQTALTAADRLGLEVDLTLGARWPASVPGLAVDGPASSKELTYGLQIIRGGAAFSGPVPAPAPKTYTDRTFENGVIHTTTRTATPRLVAVTAVACIDAACAGKPLAVDLSSRVDLTGRIQNGALEWTPPDDRSWVVTGSWARGTAQSNDAPFGNLPYQTSDPEPRVVDHFSRAGAQALIRSFRGMLSQQTLQLLRRTHASLFEDSLELTHAQIWTPRFLREFRRLRGYSLTPYLTVITNDPPPGPFQPSVPVFAVRGDDAATAARVRRDVDQTINDLYLRDHVRPLEDFAHGLGLRFRAQPYGEPIDLGQAAAAIDVPECEVLACSDDDWRTMAAGSALGGRRILSDEALPGGFGAEYGLSGPDVVRVANGQYALGANQLVWHGFPYVRWPDQADGTVVDDASRWPGWHAFSSFIGEPFGPRQPAWNFEPDLGHYYARTQAALQAGHRRLDVAVFNQSLDHVTGGYPTGDLLGAGYTFGYLTPGALALPSARVAHGRLGPDGPAFRALILNQPSIPADAARRIGRLALAGLPVIVVGDPPPSVPLSTRNVHHVATEGDVPAALASLGIDAAATSSAPGLRSVHRVLDHDTDLYYLYNPSASTITGTVTLAGPRRGVPHLYDAWTGSTRRVAQYETPGDAVRLAVRLTAGDARLVAIRRSRRGGAHITHTTADEATRQHGKLAIRDRDAGTYSVTLSTGRTMQRTIGSVPAPIDLAKWDLSVDEWRPGPPGSPSSTTAHVPWKFTDIALTPWSAIPDITDAVGVGTYTTTVNLPAGADGAYLDLGTVTGTFRVLVDGRWIGPVDQLDTHIDIGRFLHQGANEIRVQLATPLLNRLRQTRPAEFAFRPKQPYGLLGPVTLEPYGQATVAG